MPLLRIQVSMTLEDFIGWMYGKSYPFMFRILLNDQPVRLVVAIESGKYYILSTSRRFSASRDFTDNFCQGLSEFEREICTVTNVSDSDWDTCVSSLPPKLLEVIGERRKRPERHENGITTDQQRKERMVEKLTRIMVLLGEVIKDME
eukprot:PhF_6_TR15707/c0_g1_i1/m.24439